MRAATFSADQTGAGRAGLNVVTSDNPTEAYNFDCVEHSAHRLRCPRLAAETAEVIVGGYST